MCLVFIVYINVIEFSVKGSVGLSTFRWWIFRNIWRVELGCMSVKEREGERRRKEGKTNPID